MRRVLAALVVALPALLAPVAPAASADVAPRRIEHVVVVVEQDSTFDHTFGALRGLSQGIRVDKRIPQAGGEVVQMRAFGTLPTSAFSVPAGEEVLSNGSIAAKTAFHGGAMDRFARAQRDAGKKPDASFSVIDRATPSSPWRRLAGQGVVFDNYFSSALGGSLPNTLSLIANSADAADHASADPARLWNTERADIDTIFDAASTSDVTWRYYVGGLDQIDRTRIADGSHFRSGRAAPSQLYWAPVLSMERFWDEPLSASIRSQNDFFRDTAQGDLPSITYLLPQPTAHEPLILSPNLRILSVVNALRASPAWSSTAVLIVWDDWGGYYDHVKPPSVDGHQLGFRVPMLLLSPWAEAGAVAHERLDHSAIPAFAASIFGLEGFESRTHALDAIDEVWSDTRSESGRIVALSHPDHYEAKGMAHAPAVFILYLLTVVMITGVLFVVGVTLRTAPNEGGNVP